MTRRAALPGADELFRATSSSSALAEAASTSPAGEVDAETTAAAASAPAPGSARSTSLRPVRASASTPTGRERHDEKITVYLSPDELVALDEAKAALFRDHQLKVDRGRIVREAVAVVLADLASKGDHGILVRRLRER